MQPAVPPGGVPARYGMHCAVFTVDIAGFGDLRRRDPVRMRMRDAMYGCVSGAFNASGVPWGEVLHEDRGDGVLIIVPAGFPEAALIDPLLAVLLDGLAAYNRAAEDLARIRLRAALHAGHVYRDGNGLVGEAVNHTCRLLEATELKKALEVPGTDLAFITSDALYGEVVRHGQGGIDPRTFHPVDVAEKETRTRAWIHLPGKGPAQAWAGAVATAPSPAHGPERGASPGIVFYGETHIGGDAIAANKYVFGPGAAPGRMPGEPPGQAPAVPPVPEPPELGAGEDDDRP